MACYANANRPATRVSPRGNRENKDLTLPWPRAQSEEDRRGARRTAEQKRFLLENGCDEMWEPPAGAPMTPEGLTVHCARTTCSSNVRHAGIVAVGGMQRIHQRAFDQTGLEYHTRAVVAHSLRQLLVGE